MLTALQLIERLMDANERRQDEAMRVADTRDNEVDREAWIARAAQIGIFQTDLQMLLERFIHMQWQPGWPTEEGCYLLEFATGDRFVVAQSVQDEGLRWQDLETSGYVTDTPKRHLFIPLPSVEKGWE